MLFATSSASTLLAAVGAISTDVFSGLLSWIYVPMGISIAFVIAMWLISLFKHGVGSPSSPKAYDPHDDPNITGKSETDIIKEHSF